MNVREHAVLDEVAREMRELRAEVQPVIEFYNAGTTLLRWLKWAVGLGASGAAIFLAFHATGIVK